MNPASIMKLMSAKNKFQKNHPKFVAFLNRCFAGGLKEGTIIEITVTNPEEAPITSNIKVQQSDLELLEELKERSLRSQYAASEVSACDFYMGQCQRD